MTSDGHPYRDPERRLKPGVDGGLRAASWTSPPRHLRNGEILSKQTGPPHEILREFHPEYEQMHEWEREKYYRKIYIAIQRLVERFGGPSMSGPP